MSTPDKCPHCGAPVASDTTRWFECNSHVNGSFQSTRCRERTAHAETRKREELLKSQLAQTIAQRDFWEKRCDEKDGEIKRERKKWDKLMVWAKALNQETTVFRMNRLDAEAKEGK